MLFAPNRTPCCRIAARSTLVSWLSWFSTAGRGRSPIDSPHLKQNAPAGSVHLRFRQAGERPERAANVIHQPALKPFPDVSGPFPVEFRRKQRDTGIEGILARRQARERESSPVESSVRCQGDCLVASRDQIFGP